MTHRAIHRPLALILLLIAVSSATAQTFDLAHNPQPIVMLNGPWRFHPGDDPHWADTAFDDAQWPLLQSDKPWTDQGYKGLTGTAWYRFRLTLPAGNQAFALYLPPIRNCYQVFADGALIKTLGEMPPHGVRYVVSPAVVLLPAGARTETHDVTIAIRVWRDPRSNGGGGGPIASTLAGTSAAIEAHAEANLKSAEWNDSENFDTGLLFLLGAIITLTLFVMRPTEREFLWITFYNLGQGAASLLQSWENTHTHPYLRYLCLLYVLQILGGLAYILFIRELFRPPKDAYFWAAVLAFITICVGCTLFALQLVSASTANSTDALGLTVIFLWISVVLVRKSRGGDLDAQVLCVPVILWLVVAAFDEVVAVVASSGKQLSPGWTYATLTPFPLTYDSIGAVVGIFVVLALLVNRLTRSQRKQERYAAEMEAARVVQQVLLPEPNATLEGFEIAAEYFPAAEVGGDFYQILPTRSGGLLLVTGDVSGKGMPAAMLVALLVGAIRTEAAHTSDPATLLETLNTRVHGRMSNGFATCAALHILPDGSAVLSNAANPEPYLNGEEIVLPGALPLGMAAEVQYDNHRFTLQPGDVLTFVSDGVIEATKSDTGELFGFDRTRAHSHLPAVEIAETARTFGQTDDITVLTITRLAEKTWNPLTLKR